jgi:endonuclease YncB( thermonuclease family)
MARRYCRWPSLGTCLLAVLLAWGLLRIVWPALSRDLAASTRRDSLALGRCEVVGVVDGCTLLVKQGDDAREFRVRLLGVQLPEYPAIQIAASAELGRLAPLGSALIELDKRRVAEDGTWLAYVYREGTLVNAKLLQSGVATHDVYPGDSMAIGQSLKQAQAEARARRLGVWQKP